MNYFVEMARVFAASYFAGTGPYVQKIINKQQQKV
jgi:hypothetical protein